MCTWNCFKPYLKRRPAAEYNKFPSTAWGKPFCRGDFSDQDASLRPRQIKIIGDHAITYWPDHPAKTVLIIDISLADQ
jgi:hypothetical protein